MVKKSKINLIFLVSILVLTGILVNINLVNADNNVCCERLSTGQWCQNAPEPSCDDDYRKAPTSCESTTFCSTGTCIDSQEGVCEEGVSMNVCNAGGGSLV